MNYNRYRYMVYVFVALEVFALLGIVAWMLR